MTVNTLQRFRNSGLQIEQVGDALRTPETDEAIDIALDHDWNWWTFKHDDGRDWMHINRVFNREQRCPRCSAQLKPGIALTRGGSQPASQAEAAGHCHVPAANAISSVAKCPSCGHSRGSLTK